MNAFKVQIAKGTEKRLSADKPDGGRDSPKCIESPRNAHVLDRGTHPNVVSPNETVGKSKSSFWTFGQDLELVPRRTVHNIEHPLDHLERKVCMKYIGHTIHEHASGFSPTQRLVKAILPEAGSKGVSSIAGGVLNGYMTDIHITCLGLRD
jgi:hypothetical protein